MTHNKITDISGMADYNNDTSWFLQNEEEDYISRSSNSSGTTVDLMSLDYPEAAGCQVQGATDEELHWFEDFSYWTEGVVQLALGIYIVACYARLETSFAKHRYWQTFFNFLVRLCRVCGQQHGDPNIVHKEDEQHL